MIYPWPSPGDGDCMYKVGPGKHCFYPNGTRDNGDGPPVPGRAYCPGCGAPSYGSGTILFKNDDFSIGFQQKGTFFIELFIVFEQLASTPATACFPGRDL